MLIMFLAYILGAFWFVITRSNTANTDVFTFFNAYGMGKNTDPENMIIVVYYTLTTLTTVGFGDFNPKSEIERLYITLLLVVGVLIFSWVMGQFLDILLKVKEITASNEDSAAL